MRHELASYFTNGYPFRLLIILALCGTRLWAQESRLLIDPSNPALLNDSSFVLAVNGEALLYNYSGGIEGVPFLHGVYKSFGFSNDLHYFLYLKANGRFPTFALYCYDLKTGTERRLTDAAVHFASWAPAGDLLGYLWLDPDNQVHLSTYDVASGRDLEIASGQLRTDYLEWSPDASELLYLDITDVSKRVQEDGQYSQVLHRYSRLTKSDTAVPAVNWARFSGNELLVAGRAASLRYRGIPNPRAEDIRRFAIAGGDTYAEVIEGGRPVVKRWNAAAGEFETVRQGQIFFETRRGVVVRQFTQTGVEYAYVSQGAPRPLGQGQPSPITWKIPFAGLASIIQGGQLYQDGSCDGSTCFVVSHGGHLGYALDWQQMPEIHEGNTHVIATADGTIAAIANNITCNSGTPGCSVGWDNYSATCFDNAGVGNFVVIAHLDGSYSLHGHLRSGSVQVVPGQNVLQGTYLADQGHSGVAHSYNNYLGCGDHLHFSRQVGPGIWEQSIPTDFVETPCLVSCRTEYISANVELAPVPVLAGIAPASWKPGVAVPVTLTGQSFTYGSSINVGGTGITVSGITVLSPTRISATFTIDPAAVPGSYSVTVTDANGTSNAVPFNVVAPATGGMLSGTPGAPSGVQNLTAQGTSDWADWGFATSLSFNHKAGAVPQISDYTVAGTGTPARYTNDPLGYSWSDGTPTSSAVGMTTGVTVSGQNNGFRMTAPADTSSRTVNIYVGVSAAQGMLTAQLSDGSAPDYADTSLVSSGMAAGLYTLTYAAASAGQTLLITFTQNSASGSVSLQAATLSGGIASPDFGLSVTPPSLPVMMGNSNSYAVNVPALSGFANNVALAVSGVPAGVTASFNPGTIPGSGASTLTMTAASGTIAGTYPLTITATSGGITHTATVEMVVADFSVVPVPAARNAVAGSTVAYTVNVPAPAGSGAAVTFSVSGLPPGAAASFSPNSVVPGSSSIMSITVPNGTAPGTYPLTLTASSGTASHTASPTLTVTAASTAGGLAGSVATPTGTVQLTTEGSLDWAHWGLTAATDFDHKSGVPQQISNFTLVAGGNLYQYSNNSVGFTWTDGTPTASATNSTTGVYTMDLGRGFSLTAPADTTVRTLRVYVGAFSTQGRMVAWLSDGSAPDYVDTSLSNSTPPTSLAVYTFTYSAASSGQTLNVAFTQNTDVPFGNVTLQAATLAGAPDFAVNATPSSQSVFAGRGTTFTTTVAVLGGFSGAVSLGVSGLPAGATAGFNPASVTGSGSSTLTITTTAGTAPGTYPLTITATSGTLSHTAGVTLTVAPAATGGTLNGSMITPAVTAQLTSEGTADWADWGLNTVTDFNHKAGVTPQISNFTMMGTGTPTRYANNGIGFTWTDGTPTATATNSTTGVFTSGQNNGFRITVPADTTVRTLRVYVGAWRTQGQMLAQLSDGSAPDYVDTSLSNSAGVTTLGVYTFTYSAASSGQTLTITYTQNTATAGNVALQAATLAVGVLMPDFSVTAAPSSQSTTPAGSAAYTVTTTAVNGFNGGVSLAVSGLPAGATAVFSPTSITGGGSSTMTVSTTSAVAAGTYPLTITATSGNLTRTTSASLVVTDFSVTMAPASQTVAGGGNASYTATITAVNGFNGNVTLSVSGLPAGATPTFNPATVTGGSGTSGLTVTTSGTTAAGTYPLTITATSGTLSHTAATTLVVTGVSGGGTLSGSGAAPAGPIQLTNEGSLDWAHWGLNTATDFDHKTGVTPQIGNFTVVGTGTPTRYANNGIGFTWTDGTPDASATNSTTGLFITAQGNGFRITAPADTTPRILRVYVGAWRAQAQMVAHLSDGSAADYSDSTLTNNTGVTTLRVYTFTYGAASAGQTLTVTFTQLQPTVVGLTGNVALQAASLAASTPDYTIAATPGTQSVVAGGSAPYTVTVTPVNGFGNDVTLSASGLPAGVTAGFSPSTVTGGNGSSTLTLTTVAGSVAAGTYPVTITGTSGTLIHTVNATLAVTDFSVSSTPSSQSVVAGGSGTYTVTVTPANGFNGSAGFSVSGLPTGATATFSPSTVTGSGSSTMTVTAAGSTAAGNYPLTIMATSGTAVRTTGATLNITDFSVSASPTNPSLTAGSNTNLTVTVTPINGFAGTTSFGVSGLPAGVTASFVPATVSGAGSSTLTLTATTSAAPGTYPVTLTASSGGGSHTANLSLTVVAVPDFSVSAGPPSQSVAGSGSAAYTITVSPLNGFASDVALSVSGLPTGATPTFNPATVTGGSGTSALSIVVSSGTAPGNYPLTVTATSGTLTHTATVTLAVMDFSVSAAPASQSVAGSGSAGYTITVSPLNGFTGGVALSAGGLPTGATPTFNPATVTGGSGTSALSIVVSSGTAPGSYPITVTATSGSISHTATATLVVTDFSVTATPGSQTVTPAGSTSYTVTVTALSGFTGTLGFGVTGLPAGATATFSPATFAGSGSSSMTVSTTFAVAAGNYPLTITATSANLSHTASATLVVTDFSITAAPASQTVIVGGNTSYTATISPLNGFGDTVALSVSGLPAGATATFNPATVTGGSGTSGLTVTTSVATTPAGTYPLTITAMSGSLSHTAGATLIVTGVSGGGTLSGSGAAPVGTVQLTSQGSLDWAHWGLNTATDFDHKTGVTPQIGNFTVVGTGTPIRYTNNGIGFTWTDGTPNGSATNSTTGLYINSQGNGFRITAPADTTPRILRVYVGAWRAQAQMVAHLSDGSAADYSDTTLTNNTGVTTVRVYTFTYNAASAGQTLTVTFTQLQPTVVGLTGNVALQAASLAPVTPDFTVAATPGTASVVAGGSAPYTVTVSPANGFASDVALTASGLPAGVTAGFSPSTVTGGNGSSTLTLTTTASVTPGGTYPVTITGTSGTLSHPVTVNLTVTAALGTGALTGSVAAPAGPVQVTTEGTADWSQWGLNTAADFNHKASVTQQIGDFTSVLGAVRNRYANNGIGFTWTDGTPTASATNTTTGIYIIGQGQGFRLTLPADATTRTLRVYVGAWRSQGSLVAHLSDGSAADYVDSSIVNTAGTTTLGVYTLTYHAATAGQTLTVTFTGSTSAGNVAMQAATLQ